MTTIENEKNESASSSNPSLLQENAVSNLPVSSNTTTMTAAAATNSKESSSTTNTTTLPNQEPNKVRVFPPPPRRIRYFPFNSSSDGWVSFQEGNRRYVLNSSNNHNKNNNKNDTAVLPPPRIPIFVFPLHSTQRDWLVDEFKHFIHDGIVRSPYLELVTDPRHTHSRLVWLAQVKHGFAPRRWCRIFDNLLRQQQHFWSTAHPTTTLNTTTLEEEEEEHNKGRQAPTFVMMDWQDGNELFRCDDVLRPFKTYYTKRGIVMNRSWDSATRRINVGRINPYPNWTQWSAAPVLHTPYAVRTDFLETLNRVVYQMLSPLDSNNSSNNNNNGTTSVGVDTISLWERPYDVIHFWPNPLDRKASRAVDKGGKNHNSRYRDAVSQTIFDLSRRFGNNKNNNNKRKRKNITAHTKLVGSPNLVGRNQVDEAYPQALLRYKIVVVTQKDCHEEHYRLMEALVSGAMVMTDVMLSMPSDFVDGESVVVYRDIDDLRTKIRYYLWENPTKRVEIATRGRRLALGRHRSWHRMEEVFFGRILSPIDDAIFLP